MKTINDYSLREHGIMLPDYFQGQGTSFTGFDDVATGIGETATEAFEDACESLAQNGWNTASLVCPVRFSKAESVSDYLKNIGVEQSENDDSSFWYVSILVK